MISNPFFLYSLVWLGTILLYHLEISNLYPKLSIELRFFVYFSIFVSFLFGLFYKKDIKNKKSSIINKNYTFICIFICISFVLEFFIEGKIPLMETIKKTGYTYMDFKGIKSFHVLICTYNFYNTICVFNNYMFTKNKRYLIYTLFGLIPYILLYQRGPFIMLCFCLFLVWLIYTYKVKTIIKIGILGIIFLYIFGITGNIRHYYKWNDTRMIKQIAQIETKENILDPFIWGYVYITSPLGNLEYNLKRSDPLYNIKSYICDTLLFDAISKRINYEKNKSKLMIENLTVSTAYTNSFLYYGKFGMYLAFCIYMFSCMLYLKILKGKKYWIVGVVIISIINIFSIFDNMYIFSGLSFSLIYPICGIFFEKIKHTIKNIIIYKLHKKNNGDDVK